MKRIIHRLIPLLGIIFFILALIILRQELEHLHYHDVVQHLKGLSLGSIGLAALLTAFSYIALTLYDFIALSYIRHPLPYGKTSFASFTSYAISHNVGFSVFSGGSIRFRLYTAFGLSATEIANLVVFSTLTLWLGFFVLSGAIFLAEHLSIPSLLHLPFNSAVPLGILFLAFVAGYFLLILFRKNPVKIKNWTFSLPTTKISLYQVLISAVDWVLTGAVLYVLLPSGHPISFAEFLGIFLLAQLAGIISQVPGGLGVFETVIVVLLAPEIPASSSLGALLAFRGIYYILPLIIATASLGTYELLQQQEMVKRFARIFGGWVPALIPHLSAFTTFVGGAILLFSGATPAVVTRMAWLKDLLPIPIIEISHFLGSIAGVLLLFLALGLQRRLDAAYHLTVFLLIAGIVFSLFKGLDYEEAIILTVMLAALLPARKNFYRKTSLFHETFSFSWISLIILILVCTVWIGMFTHKHVDYSHDLWWHFSFAGHAPRSLRATAGAVALALFIGVAYLLRPAKHVPQLPTKEELHKVRELVVKSPKTLSNLALLGDKACLYSESGRSFLMYSVSGRSWVALGDPVGAAEEKNELVWSFRELADRYDSWPVFYQVQPDNLPLYLDVGLALLKLGEEARVRIDDFSLDGHKRKKLRHAHRKLESDGYSFEIITQDKVGALIPELQPVSDQWLERKKTREKGYSLGFFSPEYLQFFPVAIVRRDQKIVAFANVWQGAEKEELSIDLMRFLSEEAELMDYLFASLMLWGKNEGYRWFNMGMAPLSGIESRSLAPLWNRVGALVFRYGEHFYNFQGIRQYKEKFDPVWEPRYLASPGGLALPRILINLATLISGGVKGVFAK